MPGVHSKCDVHQRASTSGSTFCWVPQLTQRKPENRVTRSKYRCNFLRSAALKGRSLRQSGLRFATKICSSPARTCRRSSASRISLAAAVQELHELDELRQALSRPPKTQHTLRDPAQLRAQSQHSIQVQVLAYGYGNILSACNRKQPILL